MWRLARSAWWRWLVLAAVPAACTPGVPPVQAAPDRQLVQDADRPARLVLRGVTVIDGTGGPPMTGRDVLVRDGQIVAVVPTGSGGEMEGERVLDLAGRFVIPGLVDTHAHVTILEFHRDADGATRAEYRRDLSEQALRLLLAHGVTTVRNPSAPAVPGVALREDVARGVVVGPRIVTSGPHLNGASMSGAEIRAEVRAHAAAGVDFIKVYAALDAAQVSAAIEEAHALGLPVVGHLQRTGWTEAARLGIDGITHGASWNRELLPESRRAGYRPSMLGRIDWIDWLDLESEDFVTMLRELAARRIPVDPTLITYHTKFFGDDPRWTHHPDLRLVPELAAWWRSGGGWVADWTAEDHARARGLWPKMEAMIRRYHEAGVLLAAGSDLPQPWTIPGISLHEELELLVDAGIPAPEVLRIATRNGAEALGLLDVLGTVEVGKRADLLVLSADPTADIRNTRSIEAVIRGGQVLRPAELLEGAGGVLGPGAGPASGWLRPASEQVPSESVERGIGVVAFGVPHASGAPRIDTLRIREHPSSAAPLRGMLIFDERGPGDWYTLLAAPGTRRNLVEIAYEELAVPFDSLAGSWARVVYGQSTAGGPLRGWIDTEIGEVRTLWWADLLLKHGLFLADPAVARFHSGPEGGVLGIRLVPPGSTQSDYDLEPIQAEGVWMQIRVVVPSTCSGLPPASERIAWIRYMDAAGRPLLQARTRGC
jgi:imidazolonepropionase-like amidohydrolase